MQVSALEVMWGADTLACASATVITASRCNAEAAELENCPLLCQVMLLLCCALRQKIPPFPGGKVGGLMKIAGFIFGDWGSGTGQSWWCLGLHRDTKL